MDRRLLDAVKTAIDPDQTGDIRQEVTATIKEIAFTVHQITTTTTLSWTYDLCYVNVVTKENNTYCIEVSISGWRVIGYEKDKIDTSISSDYYETLYSLLDNYSPLYRESFGQAVIAKLNQIKATDSD